jgi:cytochrome b pre-mRNA-processing protein 3
MSHAKSITAASTAMRALAAQRAPFVAAQRLPMASRSYATPASSPPAPARAAPKPTPTNLPGSNLPGAKKYSPLTVSLVTSLAKLFGYNTQTSTAIRNASDYYDRCAERAEVEAEFFYEGAPAGSPVRAAH